jgi:hypothetical protein
MAPTCWSLSMSLTLLINSVLRACSSRIAAWRAMTWANSWDITEANSALSLARPSSPRVA